MIGVWCVCLEVVIRSFLLYRNLGEIFFMKCSGTFRSRTIYTSDEKKKVAVAGAKCGALGWQAKSVLVVTCVSEVIWHVQIQAGLSKCLCRSGCGNIPESCFLSWGIHVS